MVRSIQVIYNLYIGNISQMLWLKGTLFVPSQVKRHIQNILAILVNWHKKPNLCINIIIFPSIIVDVNDTKSAK
jgi:hypothetical protein